jgi:hypothetical protein
MADYDTQTAAAPAEAQQPRAHGQSSTGRPNPTVPKGGHHSNKLQVLTFACVAVAEAAKNKMCKNVTIYGYCRYEGKGCAFRHDRVQP